MNARARSRQKRASLMKWITVHVFASYVHVHARIIMKINMLFYMYTDSLSLKFHEDPSIGWIEIAEAVLSSLCEIF